MHWLFSDDGYSVFTFEPINLHFVLSKLLLRIWFMRYVDPATLSTKEGASLKKDRKFVSI